MLSLIFTALKREHDKQDGHDTHDKKRICGEAACRFAAIKPIMRIVRILFIMSFALYRT
jgi:hypothetical protein